MSAHSVLAFLPFAYLVLLWVLTTTHRENLGFGHHLTKRGALVVAYLAFQATVVVTTELSSFAHHFDSGTITITWGALTSVALVLTYRQFGRLHPSRARTWLRGRIRDLSVEDRVWIGLIVGSFGTLSAIACLYPPNNIDSLVYHLPRVVHWIQDRSVAHFATHYLAQIELSPLHEYNLAHLHLLAGGSDRFDGLVQLLAAAICIVVVSEIARLLGASRRGQIIASVLAATVPTGILEATSTQNNFFAASIAIALLWTVLSWQPGKGWPIGAIALGLGTGLAILTKGTIPAMIGPVIALLALLVFVREVRTAGVSTALRRTVAAGLIAGGVALAFSGAFLARNIELFGAPTGPVSQSTISSNVTLDAGFGNIVRSTAAEFWIGNGTTGLESIVSQTVLDGLKRVYAHLDVSPSDQRFALGTNTDAFKVQDYTKLARSEDFGADPWHVVLLVATAITLGAAALLGARWSRLPLLIALGLAVGYALFTYTARWSAFNVRYQLPLVIAWCPLIALVLDRIWRLVASLVLIALVLASLPALTNNLTRPLLHPAFHYSSELAPYFVAAKPGTGGAKLGVSAAEYESLTRAVAQSGCKQLGVTNWILIEYPLWAGLHDAGWGGQIEHVGVLNESRSLEPDHFRPCAEVAQIGTQYLSPDNGDLQMQFGNLALSIESSRARVLKVRAPGFESTAAGLRLFPGGGWSVRGRNAPSIDGPASLFIFSETSRSLQLRLAIARGSTARLRVASSDGPQEVSSGGTGMIAIRLHVTRGLTRIRLAPVPAPGNANPVLLTGPVTISNETG